MQRIFGAQFVFGALVRALACAAAFTLVGCGDAEVELSYPESYGSKGKVVYSDE